MYVYKNASSSGPYVKRMFLKCMEKQLRLKAIYDKWDHEEAEKEEGYEGYWWITFHDGSTIKIAYNEEDLMTSEMFYDHICYMTYKHWRNIMDERMATWEINSQCGLNCLN